MMKCVSPRLSYVDFGKTIHKFPLCLVKIKNPTIHCGVCDGYSQESYMWCTDLFLGGKFGLVYWRNPRNKKVFLVQDGVKR